MNTATLATRQVEVNPDKSISITTARRRAAEHGLRVERWCGRYRLAQRRRLTYRTERYGRRYESTDWEFVTAVLSLQEIVELCERLDNTTAMFDAERMRRARIEQQPPTKAEEAVQG